MANGHPISAVVTRADIVAKFVQKYGKNSINKVITVPLVAIKCYKSSFSALMGCQDG